VNTLGFYRLFCAVSVYWVNTLCIQRLYGVYNPYLFIVDYANYGYFLCFIATQIATPTHIATATKVAIIAPVFIIVTSQANINNLGQNHSIISFDFPQ
jgi:hypothetical protein